jgi:hypothetical protein
MRKTMKANSKRVDNIKIHLRDMTCELLRNNCGELVLASLQW